jgi:hypothetical protein
MTLPSGVSLDQHDLDLLGRSTDVFAFRASGLHGADLAAQVLSTQIALVTVNLSGSDLTDAGLQKMASLPSLVALNVQQTALSKSAIEAFHKATPDCRIYSDFGTLEPLTEKSSLPTDGKQAGAGLQRTPESADRSPNRAAAEWMQSRGGALGILFTDAQAGQSWLAAGDAPVSRPFQIYLARLPGSAIIPPLTDLLRPLKGLAVLQITSGGCDQSVLENLPRCAPLIEQLTIVFKVKRPGDLSFLASMPRLSHLTLPRDAARQWHGFSDIKLLTTLGIPGGNDEDLEALANCPQLRTIEFINGTATAPAVSRLQVRNPHVRVISTDGANSHCIGREPSREAVIALTRKGLQFEGGRWPIGSEKNRPLVPADLEADAAWNIESVNIPASVELTDADLALFNDIVLYNGCFANGRTGNSLTRLLRIIAEQRQLKGLGLVGSALTEADLRLIGEMSSLRSLWHSGSNLPRSQVEALRRTLPYCAIQWNGEQLTPWWEEAPADVMNAAQQTAEPDRAAAEWALARGASVALVLEGDWSRLVHLSGKMSCPDTPFQVTQIVFASDASLTPEDFDRLRPLREFYQATFPGTALDARSVEQLASLPQLRQLYLSESPLRTSELAPLQRLPHLQMLELGDRQADDGWATLRGMPTLRELRIPGRVERASLLSAASLRQLCIIWVRDESGLPSDFVAAMQAENPQLRLISGRENGKVRALGRDPVRDLAQRLSSRSAKLTLNAYPPGSTQRVSIQDGSDAVPFLITGIELPKGDRLDAEELRLLRGCTGLWVFHAPGLQGADDVAAALADLVLCGLIDLINTDLTDAGLRALQRLARLDVLDVRSTKVTEAAVQAFRRARPACRVFSDF